MRISSFNINKFCGQYSAPNGNYSNPRNIDFKSSIKNIVDSHLKNIDDIVFIQEFIDNSYINALQLFGQDKYEIFHNKNFNKAKSHVVAITLKGSNWQKKIIDDINSYHNKIIKMEITKSNISLQVLSFHNTHEDKKNYVKGYFKDENTQIILGDFNDEEWINDLNSDKKINYKDLVTNFMITFKPAQTSIDRIFVKNDKAIINKIVFNGVTETFASDHNLLSFLLNI